VRGFDAITGKLKRTWHPIPMGPREPGAETWQDGSAAHRRGQRMVPDRGRSRPQRGLCADLSYPVQFPWQLPGQRPPEWSRIAICTAETGSGSRRNG
jgi:hypothetical protein